VSSRQVHTEEYLLVLEGLRRDFTDPFLRARLQVLFERAPARGAQPVRAGCWVKWFSEDAYYTPGRNLYHYARVERIYPSGKIWYRKLALHHRSISRGPGRSIAFFEGSKWWEQSKGMKGTAGMEGIDPPDCHYCGKKGKGLYQKRVTRSEVLFYCQACAEEVFEGEGVVQWAT
jgi:hypothetical protein